ncbi:hypothetical protein FDG2_3340 [Candidatus Protofrankia californiensis]|uniref:Uncharacterized protein n=1 Tax=Candidatus Protofrankia californiensis TaxID=1839754 RepID=A0A1C3NZH3_9ACTN|nr:hypothetical protein [Candidatus Protofrankia californiensis]SBW22944.1 hypothetical protein FDG2_3340 [Candidatus Protofrankia californiensis]
MNSEAGISERAGRRRVRPPCLIKDPANATDPLGLDADPHLRLSAAFTELALAV